MKSDPLKFIAVALMMLLPSCSASNEDAASGGNEQVAAVEASNGAAVVDTIKTSATVTAVDASKRKVTLRMPDGQHVTVTCGPEVANFDQIAVNDRVNATITEELAIFLGRGNPPSAAGAGGVALAPIGAKPGGVVAQTMQVTAKVTAVDPTKRKVTLELPDGSKKTMRAGKQVDLSGVKPGDNITVQHTEAIAITVVEP